MRKEKALISLLRSLVEVIADEAARNLDFAKRLDRVLSEIPEGRPTERRAPPQQPRNIENLPDIHAEWKARGEIEFRFWLRDLPVPVLRALIRTHDIDPTSRASKWKEAEKLADFLADQFRARLERGGGFMGRNEQRNQKE